MATQMGGMFQDQNSNVHFNGASVGGKTNVSKAQKKGGGLGGRKPLGELSMNSANPSANQAPKKQHTTLNFTRINDEFSASKSTYSVGGKKSNLSKAQEKKLQTGGRKPLGDISNSAKPCMQHQALKKNQNYNLNAVVEEELNPSAIAEEQFLHNHQDCIKAQRNAVNIGYFLETIGLHNDFSLQLASSPQARKLKPENPSRYLESDDDMAELLVGDFSTPCRKTELFLGKHKSSPPCKSPKSPNLYEHWKDLDFKLIDLP